MGDIVKSFRSLDNSFHHRTSSQKMANVWDYNNCKPRIVMAPTLVSHAAPEPPLPVVTTKMASWLLGLSERAVDGEHYTVCVRYWRTLLLGSSAPTPVEKECVVPWCVCLWLWSGVKDSDTCVMLVTCTIKMIWWTRLIKGQGLSTFLTGDIHRHYLTLPNAYKMHTVTRQVKSNIQCVSRYNRINCLISAHHTQWKVMF